MNFETMETAKKMVKGSVCLGFGGERYRRGLSFAFSNLNKSKNVRKRERFVR